MQPLEPILRIVFLAFLAEGLVEYLARPILTGLAAPDEEAVPSTKDTLVPAPQVQAKNTKVESAEANSLRSPNSSLQTPMWLRYVAVAVGVGLACAYRIDLLAMVGLETWTPWIGYVITGLLIGRGSNYVHDLVDRWLTAESKPPNPS